MTIQRIAFPTLVVFILLPFMANAGGPNDVIDGKAVVWPEELYPIPYHVDRGDLGPFTQSRALALVQQAFDSWQAVEGSAIHFQWAGSLPVDVDRTNYASYIDINVEGRNPIVFDDDGEIISDLFGAGSKTYILGFAGPVTYNNGQIISAQAVLNGIFFQEYEIGESEFYSTLLHEFGHFIGLDHAQLMRHIGYDGVGGNDIDLPIMFPTVADDDSVRTQLSDDDRLAVSNIYPEPAYARQSGNISGVVWRNGQEMPGVNVTARRIGFHPRHNYTTVTGTYKYNRGTYELTGLPPGDYQLFIEPIDRSYTDISSVGRYAYSLLGSSFRDPVQSRFYADENTEYNSRSTWSPVRVEAGKSLTGIDFDATETPSALEENDTQILGLNAIDTAGAPSTGLSEFQFLLVPSGMEKKIILIVTASESEATFDLIVQKERRVDLLDDSNSTSVEGTATVTLAPNEEIPLESSRYFIAVRNRGTGDITYVIETKAEYYDPPTPTPTVTPTPTPSPIDETPTATPSPSRTPRPTRIPTATRTPTVTPSPTAVELNPALGLVSLDEVGGSYPRGAAVHNFDIGISDQRGNLLVTGVFDGLPDPASLGPLLFINGVFYPIAQDMEFSGEIDPEGNGSEGIYFLLGGNIGGYPPVVGRLGAVGGPNRGGIDINNNTSDNLDFGTFSGDLIPVAPIANENSSVLSYDIPLVDLEPAGNQGFYALDRSGRIYAEGTARETLDRRSLSLQLHSPVEAVDLEIFRGRRISLTNSRYSENLIGTGAYILDNQGAIHIIGNASALQASSLPPVTVDGVYSYREMEFIPNAEGTEFIGLGVLDGEGMISFVPFEDVSLTPELEEYIQFLNPFGRLPRGFTFDISRGFEVEISDEPIYGKNERGETITSRNRRVGIFMFDGFGGIHTGGRSTRFAPIFGAIGDDTRIINGYPAVPFMVSIPYFGADITRDLEIAPLVRRSP